MFLSLSCIVIICLDLNLILYRYKKLSDLISQLISMECFSVGGGGGGGGGGGC